MNEHIAFIGVRRMGGRMSKRLLDAGYDLVVLDPSADAVAALVEQGARAAAWPPTPGSSYAASRTPRSCGRRSPVRMGCSRERGPAR